MNAEQKKIILAAAYRLAMLGDEEYSERLLSILRPPVTIQESDGNTATKALQAAMDRGATHIRRLARPGGSGIYRVEFETRPGCEPVRFPGEG